MNRNLINLEKRVKTIESRNQQVEKDKRWLNAIVPSIGFLLSTLTLPFFKSIWEKLKN